jgi:hypothetical protein
VVFIHPIQAATDATVRMTAAWTGRVSRTQLEKPMASNATTMAETRSGFCGGRSRRDATP